jgi:two-component system, LytTR family, response regulator
LDITKKEGSNSFAIKHKTHKSLQKIMNLPITQKAGNNHVVINQKLSRTLPLHEIVMCEGRINYTVIYMKSGKMIVSAHTLKSYENALSELGFTRIHRAYLINSQHYGSFDSLKSTVLMKNGIALSVSRRRVSGLHESLSKNI